MSRNKRMPGKVKMTALAHRAMPRPVAAGVEFWADSQEDAERYAGLGWARMGWGSEPEAEEEPEPPRRLRRRESSEPELADAAHETGASAVTSAGIQGLP